MWRDSAKELRRFGSRILGRGRRSICTREKWKGNTVLLAFVSFIDICLSGRRFFFVILFRIRFIFSLFYPNDIPSIIIYTNTFLSLPLSYNDIFISYIYTYFVHNFSRTIIIIIHLIIFYCLNIDYFYFKNEIYTIVNILLYQINRSISNVLCPLRYSRRHDFENFLAQLEIKEILFIVAVHQSPPNSNASTGDFGRHINLHLTYSFQHQQQHHHGQQPPQLSPATCKSPTPSIYHNHGENIRSFLCMYIKYFFMKNSSLYWFITNLDWN